MLCLLETVYVFPQVTMSSLTVRLLLLGSICFLQSKLFSNHKVFELKFLFIKTFSNQQIVIINPHYQPYSTIPE